MVLLHFRFLIVKHFLNFLVGSNRLMVLKFSLPIMLLEEILKFVGRRVIEWKEIAARKVRDAASQLDGGQHSVFPPPFF